jgi:hypothetical protein
MKSCLPALRTADRPSLRHRALLVPSCSQVLGQQGPDASFGIACRPRAVIQVVAQIHAARARYVKAVRHSRIYHPLDDHAGLPHALGQLDTGVAGVQSSASPKRSKTGML